MSHTLLKAFDRTTEALAGLFVVLLLAAVAAGVVTRALNDPLSWTDEAARMLMVWLAMFGWILSTRRRAHVRIRYFQAKLPPAAHRAAETVIQAAMLLLGLVATWFGVDLVMRNLDLDATSLPISIAWLYVPLVPAGIVTTLQAAAEAAAQLRPADTPP